MVIGTDAYNFIASDFHRPLVVAGFEPLDLLQGVVMLVEQKIAAHSKVENQYRRVVPDAVTCWRNRQLLMCSVSTATANGAA